MPEPTTGTTDPNTTQSSTDGGTPGTTIQVPAGFVEKARLDGALLKIQELTLANRSLTDQLAAKDQAIGSLQAQQAQKETEFVAKVGEHSTSISTLTAENADLASQLAKFKSLEAKVKAINELKRPELFSILDTIPDAQDDAQLKASLTKLASFADELRQKRETELLAGVTHTETQPGGGLPAMPADEKGWMALVESKPFGSKERDKVWQDYFNFVAKPK